MKKQFRFWLLITLIGSSVALIAGCSNKTLKDATQTPQVTTQPQLPQGTQSTLQGTTTPQTPLAVSAGEADYTQNCAICHESPPPTKDLQQIIKVVNSGKGRMPSFKGKLSTNQIQAIANYIVK
ncbi:MAG: cytochrome c [Desulfosporosinus sp.]|nr:cytochrome c [Desulfosporosinus sp.]